MKKIILNLEKQLKNLKELIQNREDIFDERSEKWQESEKGEFFQDQTLEMESQSDILEGVIDDLKQLQ